MLPRRAVQTCGLKWKDLLIDKNPSLEANYASVPIVTSGITHGLSIVADMFVERGDLVLLPEMYWGNYNMIFGVGATRRWTSTRSSQQTATASTPNNSAVLFSSAPPRRNLSWC